MEIRSFRRVFELERRVYRIDRLRLNPGGVPVRGVVYAVALIATSLVLETLPLVGLLYRTLPWYLRDLGLPIAIATGLTALRIEGRPFHHSALSLLRWSVAPRREAGWSRCSSPGERWRPDPVVFLPDGSDGSFRRLRYRGPGAVLVATEHVRRGSSSRSERARLASGRPSLELRALPRARPLKSAHVLLLADSALLLVHGEAREAGPR
jgi:hypothetical protein